LSAWGRKGSWAVGGVAQHILLSTVCVFVCGGGGAPGYSQNRWK